jgi:hypothetical protein
VYTRIASGDRLAAYLAHRYQTGGMTAAAMFEHDRTTARVGQVTISPLHKADDDWMQVQAHRGQVVLETRWVRRVQPFFEQAVLDETLEASGEHVAGDAQVLLHLIEPVRAEEQLAQDQQAPGVAEHGQSAGDRAGVAIEIRIATHAQGDSLPHWVAHEN